MVGRPRSITTTAGRSTGAKMRASSASLTTLTLSPASCNHFANSSAESASSSTIKTRAPQIRRTPDLGWLAMSKRVTDDKNVDDEWFHALNASHVLERRRLHSAAATRPNGIGRGRVRLGDPPRPITINARWECFRRWALWTPRGHRRSSRTGFVVPPAVVPAPGPVGPLLDPVVREPDIPEPVPVVPAVAGAIARVGGLAARAHGARARAVRAVGIIVRPRRSPLNRRRPRLSSGARKPDAAHVKLPSFCRAPPTGDLRHDDCSAWPRRNRNK